MQGCDYMYEFKRSRSRFWLRIFENEASISIATNGMTRRLIHFNMPYLAENSPKGWQPSANYPDTYTLWLPDSCYDYEDLESLKAWADRVNQYIWLGINKNTEPYFVGNELDLCVAYDWNFEFGKQIRTPAGKAEYNLKYHQDELTHDHEIQFKRILADAVQDCVMALPVDLRDFVVTTIPAVVQDQNKISWWLSNFVARTNYLPFIGVSLTKPKPQMKSLPLQEKIRIWRSIYEDSSWVIVPNELYGRNILIVDDLFQSGASLFCFAEFLKSKFGAKQVIAVTSVKSQRDGDNT